jgi:hypothetical protein
MPLRYLLFLLICFQANAQAPAFDLAVRIGEPLAITGVGSDAMLTKAVLDAAGNSYVTGYFHGSVRFGSTLLTSNNSTDVFVAKLDPAGNYVWVVRAGGAGNEEATDLALDASGNAYITGNFSGATSTFGTTTLVNPVPIGNSPEAFVAQLDPSGTFRWAISPGGGPGGSEGFQIALDAQGNAYITGRFTGAQLTFGPSTIASLSPQYDWFVAKLSAAGSWLWGVRGGGTGTDEPLGIAVDASANAYVTGYVHSRSASFGSSTVTMTGGGGAVVAKLSPAGAFQWAVLGGGNGPLEDSGDVIALDGRGNVFVSGTFHNNGARFGTTALSNAGDSDLFMGQLDAAAGTWRWAVRAGGTGRDGPLALLADGQGGVYVTGYYQNAATSFGPTTLPYQGMYYDAFVAKLDAATGTWPWALRMGGTQNDVGYSLGLDQSSRLHVAGYYQSPSLDLPPLTLPGPTSVYTAGSGFLARLGPEPKVSISGDSLLCSTTTTLTATAPFPILAYQWSTGATTPSIQVTQPGLYSVTVTLANGRTSTARLQVSAFTPTVRISGDSLLCAGTVTTLTAVAAGPAPVYQWSTGATTPSIQVNQPGTYSVTARYGACTATAQHRLRMPTIRLSGDSLLCGSTTPLTALATGATALRWSTGATTPTIAITQPGSYSVTATFANGCLLTATQRISRPTIAISGDTVLCVGNAATLTARLSAPSPSYLWSTGATTASIRITQPGSYTVTARSQACESTRVVRVRAVPSLANFTLGPDTTLCASQPLVLRAPAQVGNATYRWSDGSTNATLLVSASGVYTLRITTACGEHMTVLRVTYQNCVRIPNVVTANSDGVNDRFSPQGLGPGPWALTIYNRWGKQVYATDRYENNWGDEAAAGVYYYVLRQAGAPGWKGWVEVIR